MKKYLINFKYFNEEPGAREIISNIIFEINDLWQLTNQRKYL